MLGDVARKAREKREAFSRHLILKKLQQLENMTEVEVAGTRGPKFWEARRMVREFAKELRQQLGKSEGQK